MVQRNFLNVTIEYLREFEYFRRSFFQRFTMECREYCGACCIAASISSPIPGMPDGKPAGVRCKHLLDDYKCALFGDTSRPKVCIDYKPEPEFCGKDREDAMTILKSLS